jgi:hypothetical protein
VIAHGNSSRRAISSAIHLAARGVEHDVVARLAARMPEASYARRCMIGALQPLTTPARSRFGSVA